MGKTVKTTYRADVLIAAYAALSSAKLTKIETVNDKLKVVDAIRVLKPVATGHDDAMESARESLKPEGLDAIVKSIKDGANPSQLDMLKHNILQAEYNEALAKYERKQLDIEIDIKIPPLSKEIVERVIEGNPSWTAAQILAVTDIFM